ncbi:MAG: SDR family oxidoreductase [Myxococcales bacterium]|nr:MAG: SDR family oxidoreductase [Myxococcales bacterium]
MVLENSATTKWFLVSGGGGGIGAAVCSELAAAGYKPIVGYHRSQSAAESVATRCGGVSLQLDLTDDASIDSALVSLAELPLLGGVVLAASPPLAPGPFGKITEEQLREQLRVNVVGPQRLLAGLVKGCFRKHKAGTVVGVLTQAMGDEQTPASAGLGAYVIAKYGMAGLLAALAAEYPWLSVRSVRPGYTETPMLEAFDSRFLDLQRSKAPFATPAQVASRILTEISA